MDSGTQLFIPFILDPCGDGVSSKTVCIHKSEYDFIAGLASLGAYGGCMYFIAVETVFETVKVHESWIPFVAVR
jgi:hypothetical protein